MSSRRHITILGGGFAGLETAFLLRERLADLVDVSVISEQPFFLFHHHTIRVPFGFSIERLRLPLVKPMLRQGIHFLEERVEDVDAETRWIHLGSGRKVPFDFLVIATGAAPRPQEVPGLAEHGVSVWNPRQMLDLRRRIELLVARREPSRVLLLVPPGNRFPKPLYELALLLDDHLRSRGVRDRIELAWATCEDTYLQVFGPRMHDVIARALDERGIPGLLRQTVTEVSPGTVRFTGGAILKHDLLICAPPTVAKVRYGGLPTDDRGFLLTCSETRAVAGTAGIYAIGDAGDFPVKQAFLAFLQAEVAVEGIAAALAERKPRFSFAPVSLCVLGQCDTATFVQVPLDLTGDALAPAELAAGAWHEYKLGTSPLWCIGGEAISHYLSSRFRASEPFHAGAAWRMLELGLQGLTGLPMDLEQRLAPRRAS